MHVRPIHYAIYYRQNYSQYKWINLKSTFVIKKKSLRNLSTLHFTLVETFFSKRFHKNRKNAFCQFIQIFSTAKQILNFFNFWNVFIIRSTRM